MDLLIERVLQVIGDKGGKVSFTFISTKLYPTWARSDIERAVDELVAKGVLLETVREKDSFYTLADTRAVEASIEELYKRIYSFVDSQNDKVSSDLIRKTMIRQGCSKDLISEALERLVSASRLSKTSLNKRVFYSIVKPLENLPMSLPTPPAAKVKQTLADRIIAFLKEKGCRIRTPEIVVEMRKLGFERPAVIGTLKVMSTEKKLSVEDMEDGNTVGWALPVEEIPQMQAVNSRIVEAAIMKCLVGSLEMPKFAQYILQEAEVILWFGVTRTPAMQELVRKTFEHLVETKKIRKVLGPNGVLQGYVSQQEIDGEFPLRETMDQTRERLRHLKENKQRQAARNKTPWFKYQSDTYYDDGNWVYHDCVLTQNIGPYSVGMIIPQIEYYADPRDGSMDHVLELKLKCEKDRQGNYTYNTVYACLVKSMLGEALTIGPDGPVLD